MRSCPRRRRDRLRPWRLGRIGALLALAAVVLTATLAGRTSNSAFTATATNPGNRAGSATLNPVTGLSATPTCSAGAAPTYVTTAYNSNYSSSSPVDLKVPAGTKPGDLLVVHILRDGASAPIKPADFSLIHGDTASGIGSWVYQRVATASDPGTKYSWTVSGSSASGIMSTFRGAAGLIAESSSRAQAYSSKTATMRSVTADAANSLLVFLIAAQTGKLISRQVEGMTLRYEAISNNTAFRAYSEIRTQTGATGERSITDLGTSSPLATAGLLIRPAPPVVELSWTASPSTFADGYQIRRNGVVVATLAGRTTTTWTDSAASAGSHTWSVVTTAQSWRSAAVTATSAC